LGLYWNSFYLDLDFTNKIVLIFDQTQIDNLKQALKSQNFEIRNFSAHKGMAERISKIDLNKSLMSGQKKMIAENKMSQRIIRLKKKSGLVDTITRIKGKPPHSAAIPQAWIKKGDILSRPSINMTVEKTLKDKLILLNKRNEGKHSRTRSYNSFGPKQGKWCCFGGLSSSTLQWVKSPSPITE